MQLERSDIKQFFQLHQTLMVFVNQRLKVISVDVATTTEYAILEPAVRIKVHEALLANIGLIDSFVAENPAQLSKGDLEIVSSWRHLVAGQFYVFRELAKYTVFLSATAPTIAYGVVALAQSFDELIAPELPVLVKTILLPFKGKIVFDGLMTTYGITFGPGFRRSRNEDFKEAKARHGIVVSLPIGAETVAIATKTTKAKPRPKAQAPKDDTAEPAKVIGDMIEQFCREHLNEEYAELCRKLTDKLARKRPSPLVRGQPITWATGIVRTIGWVNFLDDNSQKPHMKLTTIDKIFGVGQSTGQVKSAEIRKMFKIRPMDPAWTLKSRMDSRPMAWMIKYNGFYLDARLLTEEHQKEALRKGLIPYLPGKRVPAADNDD